MKKYEVFIGDNSVFGLGSPISSCGIMYVAYQEANGEIVEERGRVLFDGDKKLFTEMQSKVQENSIISIQSIKEGKTFYVKEILNLNVKADQKQKIYLEKQAEPVTFIDEKFGEFLLNKRIDSFEGSTEYNGNKISIMIDNKEECIKTLHIIYEDIDSFLEKAAKYAAQKLLELADIWCQDAWDEDDGEYVTLTEVEFINRMTIETISLSENGNYSLWYDDGDMFWGHAICVDGNINEGFKDASMQG